MLYNSMTNIIIDNVVINTTYIGNYNVVINQCKYTSVTIPYIYMMMIIDDDDDNDDHEQRR